MSIIKIILSAVALISTLLFLFSVYFVLGKKKSEVPQITKTPHHFEKQKI